VWYRSARWAGILGLGGVLGGLLWVMGHYHEVVIQNGRVVRPDGTVKTLSIGIRRGRIHHIHHGPLWGHRVIDATHHVVVPGFIDVGGYPRRHSLAWHDGVTTALAIAPGVAHPESVTMNPSLTVLAGLDTEYCRPSLPRDDPHYVRRWAMQIGHRLEQGGIAIHWKMPSDPHRIPTELAMMLAIAKRYQVALVVSVPMIDTEANGRWVIQQLGRGSQASGVLVVMRQWPTSAHLWTTHWAPLVRQWPLLRWTFSPYTADIRQWGDYPLGTLRQLGARMVTLATGEDDGNHPADRIVFVTTQRQIQQAILDPQACVGRDATIRHPREVAAFSRLIRRWVIDGKRVTWIEAVQCMSERPIKWWGDQLPALQKKGRLANGFDADVVMIDPDAIEDWATYQLPDTIGQGVMMVMIKGKIVWQAPPQPRPLPLR